MSVVLGAINQPFFDFMEMIFKNTAEAISRKVSVPFFKLIIFLKLGRFSNKPNTKDTWRTKCF